MKLNVKTANPQLVKILKVIGLPGGGALILHTKNWDYFVSRLDEKGISSTVYSTGGKVSGLILFSSEEMLVLGKYGNIAHVVLTDGNKKEEFKVDVGELVDGLVLDNDNLLLVDNEKGELFTYNMTSKSKKPLLDKLGKPTSVAKQLTNKGNIIYLICYARFNKIEIYDSNWTWNQTLKIDFAQSAVFASDNTMFVAHENNVSEYTLDGALVRHWLNKQDGINRPAGLSFIHPYLWVIYEETSRKLNVKCFEIYQEDNICSTYL